MAIHKQQKPLPNTSFAIDCSYKGITNEFIRSTQQPRAYQPRRSQRLAKQRRERTPHTHSMGSDSSSAHSPLGEKPTMNALMWKQTNANVRPQPSNPPLAPIPKEEAPDNAQPSFLENLTDGELSRALSYYYNFPQNLPHRDCGAHRRVDGPVPEILIDFDENIFSRKMCLRPLSEDDMESVDPFTLDNAVRR